VAAEFLDDFVGACSVLKRRDGCLEVARIRQAIRADRPEFRQALSHAVDREAIVKTLAKREILVACIERPVKRHDHNSFPSTGSYAHTPSPPGHTT
jgi:ABC-type transport system substrate-binding protein